MAINILRRRQLEQKIGLRHSAIYDRLNSKSRNYDPSFPRPINLGNGKRPSIGWIESEVEAWLAARAEKSRKVAA